MPRVAVVIPTWNEARAIKAGLAALAEQGADEVVVADASSPDGTADLARSVGVRVVTSPRGRGVQQNRGASATTSEVLVFLHADCRLAPGALDTLRRFVPCHPKVPGGCFRMRVDNPSPPYRLIDRAADVRAGCLGVPYGDQAVFVNRWAFDAVGGFPEVPLMDDVFLALSLRRLGRLALLPGLVHVSDRRWAARGLLRQSLTNWALTAAAACGVSTGTLARFYPVVR